MLTAKRKLVGLLVSLVVAFSMLSAFIQPSYAFSSVQTCLGAGSTTCTMGANMTVGNTLYVGVISNACDSPTPTPTVSSAAAPEGFLNVVTKENTRANNVGCSATLHFAVWIFTAKVTVSGQTAITYSLNGGGGKTIEAEEVSGGASMYADTTSTGSAASGTMTVASFTPAAGDFVFAAGSQCSISTYTAGTGFSLVKSNAGAGCNILVSTGGEGTEHMLSSDGSATTCPMTPSATTQPFVEVCASFPALQTTTTATATTTATSTATSTISVNVSDPPNLLWLLLIPVFMAIVLAARKAVR